MTNATVVTIQDKIKEIKVQVWKKPICLYCRQPLFENPRNSANFIGSVCGECYMVLRNHNMVISDVLTATNDN